MTKTELATLVSGFGFPYAYYQFTEDTAQPPPFVCFFISGSNDMPADNQNYCAIRRLNIELYTDAKDYESEVVIEAALKAAGIVYSTEETYIDSERLYMVIYQADILFTEENQDA